MNLNFTEKQTPGGPVPRSEQAYVLIPNHQSTSWLLEINQEHRSLNWFGGHMEPGESPRQTAIRETMEEIGLQREDFEVRPALPIPLEFCRVNPMKNLEKYYRVFFFWFLPQAPLDRSMLSVVNAVWVTDQEIRRGISKDGRRVWDFVRAIHAVLFPAKYGCNPYAGMDFTTLYRRRNSKKVEGQLR